MEIIDGVLFESQDEARASIRNYFVNGDSILTLWEREDMLVDIEDEGNYIVEEKIVASLDAVLMQPERY